MPHASSFLIVQNVRLRLSLLPSCCGPVVYLPVVFYLACSACKLCWEQTEPFLRTPIPPHMMMDSLLHLNLYLLYPMQSSRLCSIRYTRATQSELRRAISVMALLGVLRVVHSWPLLDLLTTIAAHTRDTLILKPDISSSTSSKAGTILPRTT